MLDEALDLLRWEWAIFPVHATRPDGECTCGVTRAAGHDVKNVGKHPRTPNGLHDASKEPDVIMGWWQRRGWKQANIALACGEVSGVWVLDEDMDPPVNRDGNVVGMSGPEALAEYQRRYGPLPETLESRTGSGGRHFFFRMPEGRTLRNHVKLAGPDGRKSSLDVRANGGYVVLPPSTHASGNGYSWTRKMWPPAEAPAWLLDLVDPPKVEQVRPVRTTGIRPDDATRAQQYAFGALEGACARVAATGKGARNDTLNREAYTIAGYVGSGCLEEFKAREDLVNAGVEAGLPEKEARGIVSRALAAGAAKPVDPQLQEREEPWQRASSAPPPIPVDDGYWDSLEPPPQDDAPDDVVGAPVLPEQATIPSIVAAKRQGSAIIEEAWAAIHARNNPPRIWLQNGNLVQIRRSERGPTIAMMTPTHMQGELLRAARWVKWRKARPEEASKSGFVHEDMEHPPTFVAEDMHAGPDDRLPVLEGLTFAPSYSRDGRLLDMPGYHAAGRCYYEAAAGFRREAMTPQDAMVLLFGEWLADFPFSTDADRAHTLALLLLPFVRRMIDGPTPGHVIEAATPGSGKSLLGRCLCAVSLGRVPDALPFADNEEERRKAYLTALASGRPVIFTDNVKGRIESATIEGMLTSTAWADRNLGVIGEIRVPNLATWIFTVNNADVSLDMARRCIRIRLDPRCERPEERTGFRISEPLETWTLANRTRLISACLALVDHWLTHREPYRGPVMGSFESWAQTVGGIIQSLGFGGFLEDRRAFREAADSQGREWRTFVEAVVSRPVLDPWWTVKDLLGMADEVGLLAWATGDGNERSRQIKLGRVLQKRRDTVTSGYRLEIGSNRSGTVYKFERIA